MYCHKSSWIVDDTIKVYYLLPYLDSIIKLAQINKISHKLFLFLSFS